jgi:glutathione S-transferase
MGPTISRGAAVARWTDMRLYDYPASANCYKVRLLLAQLELEAERVPVDIFDGDTLTDAFAELNPARGTPVLELPGRGVLPESNAILAYLAEGTPLLPAERLARAQVLRWLLFEQTDVMGTIGGLRFRLMTGRWDGDEPEAQRRRAGALETLALLDAELAARPFLAGDRYTIADIAVYAYTHVAGDAGLPLADHPEVVDWLARVEATPRFMNDLVPYPANAAVLAGRSVYG